MGLTALVTSNVTEEMEFLFNKQLLWTVWNVENVDGQYILLTVIIKLLHSYIIYISKQAYHNYETQFASWSQGCTKLSSP